jgi:predicted RNase H-like HicB family nuclease
MARIAYTVVIERAPRNLSAYVPDLPGCVAAGATEDEVLREMAKAIRFDLEGLIEDGEPIPPAQSASRTVETELAVA